MNWTELIEEYRQELKALRKQKRLCTNEKDLSIITQMITSTSYALRWLEAGKCPDNTKSIENYSYDQRTIEIDPQLLECCYSEEDNIHAASNDDVDQEKLFRVNSALATLTDKEKEVFILFEGQQLNRRQIAEWLDIKQTTVDTMLRRARHKIKLQKDADIFLIDPAM